MSIENQWLNVHDVAELLQVTPETVRRWIRRRELPVLELGGPRAGYRIRREDLNHFIWQRYRMSNQESTDRASRGEFAASSEHAMATSNVRVQANTQSMSLPAQISVETASTHELTHPEDQRYLSLMSRIPGVTFIATGEGEENTPRRRIIYVSRHFERLMGIAANTLRSSERYWWERVHPDDQASIQESRQQSVHTGGNIRLEYRIRDRTGGYIWVRDEAVLSDAANGHEPLWQGITLNITDRKNVEAALTSRLQQQAAVAELGEHALHERDLTQLLDEAVQLVQQSLNAEFIKLLELLPGGNALRMRAGVGWKPTVNERSTVTASAESQAGYTLLSNEPVVVHDLRTEHRFDAPPLLVEHGVCSGISVIIAGVDKPWGVLGAHSTAVGAFTVDDLSFVQSVANVVASAVRASRDNQTPATWLSIRDVADTLRVQDETVRRWIRRGDLPIIDLGSSRAGYRIHPTDLEHFIQQRYTLA